MSIKETQVQLKMYGYQQTLTGISPPVLVNRHVAVWLSFDGLCSVLFTPAEMPRSGLQSRSNLLSHTIHLQQRNHSLPITPLHNICIRQTCIT
jgi:hypothetical protein